MSLLPSHHDQFRSKDYWDRFFLERGGEQFEWYGTFAEIEVRKDTKTRMQSMRRQNTTLAGDQILSMTYTVHALRLPQINSNSALFRKI